MQPLISPLENGELDSAPPRWLGNWGGAGSKVWRFYLRTYKHVLYLDSLKRQTKHRGKVAQHVWATPRQREISQQIAKILADACWGEELSFHPSDPWAVIGDFEIGDLDELDAVWRIEKAYGLPSPCHELWDHVPNGLTFGAVVSYIEQNEQRQET